MQFEWGRAAQERRPPNELKVAIGAAGGALGLLLLMLARALALRSFRSSPDQLRR